MSGKEEWVLVSLGSLHKCVERPVRLVFPDYLFLVTMVKCKATISFDYLTFMISLP